MSLAILLLSPVLVVVVASRLVDFRSRWPPRIAVLLAAAAPTVIVLVISQQADAISSAAAVYMSPLFAFYGLIVGGLTYAIVRPL